MYAYTENGQKIELNDTMRREEFAAAQRSSSASAELDRKVREFMVAHNESSYRAALEMVRLDPANEGLLYSYATGREPGRSGDNRPRSYSYTIEDASGMVLAKAKVFAELHNLDLATAAQFVLNDPENAELRRSYLRAA